MAEPLEELADRDHADEDQADDEHREDDVTPLLGDVAGGEERCDGSHASTLTNATAMRIERCAERIFADFTRHELAELPRLAA